MKHGRRPAAGSTGGRHLVVHLRLRPAALRAVLAGGAVGRFGAAVRAALSLLPAAAGVAPLAAQAGPYDSGGALIPEQAAYDVTFYELDLRVDPSDSSIAGAATLHARAVADLEQLVVDLDPVLRIEDVRGVPAAESETAGRRSGSGAPRADAAAPLPFRRQGGKVWIDLDAPVRSGEEVAVTITYGGRPRIAPNPPWEGGFTWARTADGSPWIGTSSFSEGGDLWRPIKDHPSDEADSTRLRITVPAPLVVASNGRAEGMVERDGWRTWRWFVSTPINNYDVALNIAPYEVVEASYASVAGDAIPVSFWVLPEHLEAGRRLMPEILDQLRFYEATLGPYPFRADKYGVAETPFLGMEHQTIIAYGAQFDHGAMTRGVDWGFDALHQHELSHEWWGNLVTASDFKDLWLHEGFGTYMQPLYLEARRGRAAYHAYMDTLRTTIENRIPLAPRETMTAKEIYGGDVYAKGAWVLHTLRWLVGEDAFRTALRRMAYPERELEAATDGRQTRFVGSDDFVAAAEAASGTELDWFFDVYLRQPRLPALVAERGPEGLTLRWDVPGGLPFPMPVEVEVAGRRQRVEMPGGRAVLPLEAGVVAVVDPNGWILKEAVEPTEEKTPA
jgi:aminopeptidase N